MQILIKKIRKEKGITLRELEELSGISKTALNDYETGKISPSMDIMEWVALALDTTINALFNSEVK